MSEVTRDEFDRLVERVTRVEHTLGATVEIVASEVVGLRTYLDERFARVDERFDHQDRMLDALGAEVQVEFDAHARAMDRIVGLLEHQAGVQAEQGVKLDAQAGVQAEQGVKLDAQAGVLAEQGVKLDAQAGVLAEQGGKLDRLLDRFGIDPTS